MMPRHSLIAMLGPDLLAQKLAEIARGPDLEIARKDSAPPAPEEPIRTSGRPGTNRHARRARAAMARRNK